MEPAISDGLKPIGARAAHEYKSSSQSANARLSFTSENAEEILSEYDLLIDGTDNFATRYLSNDVSVFARKPNVYDGSVNRTRAIADVDREVDRAVVTWDDGGRSTFHHLWLRDNCPCPSCRDPSVPERLVDTLSIADKVAPEAVGVTATDGLDVTWAGDGHRSKFAAEWLEAHADQDGPRFDAPARTLWSDGAVARRPRSPTPR